MSEASAALDFEQAAKYRDALEDVKIALAQNQRAIQGNLDSYDVIGASCKDLTAAVCIMIIRNGKIIGTDTIQLDVPNDSTQKEILEYFIKVYYTK